MTPFLLPSEFNDLFNYSCFPSEQCLQNFYEIFFTTRFNYTYPSQGQEFGDELKSGPGENSTVEKQGCHPFYESLIDDPYVAEVSYSYRTLQFFVEIL